MFGHGLNFIWISHAFFCSFFILIGYLCVKSRGHTIFCRYYWKLLRWFNEKMKMLQRLFQSIYCWVFLLCTIHDFWAESFCNWWTFVHWHIDEWVLLSKANNKEINSFLILEERLYLVIEESSRQAKDLTASSWSSQY